MSRVAGNLSHSIPASLPEELLDVLISTKNVRIERIVSRGHASPPGFWYDQEQHEFVLLVSGRACLAFADGSPPRELAAGDWLLLPAHHRHRVDWTDPEQDTVWLAVHYGRQSPAWVLWRQDDNGQRFRVGTFGDRADAEARQTQLEAGLHRQIYWIEIDTAESPGLQEMLQEEPDC